MTTPRGDGGFFCDRKSRKPRLWSNRQLEIVAPQITGDVVNVSAWKDEDKEGRHYRDYFSAASGYHLTNWKREARGFQGRDAEIALDLETPCPPELEGRYDLAFSHTVLEHVFDVRQAFATLCALSRDSVIVVVPFLQPMHDAHYGDYWRFTPQTLLRLFEGEGMSLPYVAFNSHPKTSVYLFAVATRNPERWKGRLPPSMGQVDPRQPWDGQLPYVGCHAIPNGPLAWKKRFSRWFRRPRPKLPDPLPETPQLDSGE